METICSLLGLLLGKICPPKYVIAWEEKEGRVKGWKDKDGRWWEMGREDGGYGGGEWRRNGIKGGQEREGKG
jgi:hypothetical protein